jgi:UDP-N-acetylglucosamine 2-epimerase (non-hydrolysing)
MTSPREESPTATNKSILSPSFSQRRVLVIFGTRPEAIKLCPLITQLRSRQFQPLLKPVVCVTGQHRELLRGVLEAFSIEPDYDLDLMSRAQTLSALASRLLSALEPVFVSVQPSLAVVQGDTSTTFAGALASFYARVPVAHVEAGLRTFDMDAPFPEEMNRVLTSRFAALHFPPTEQAAENLRREGILPECIQVTGNTGIDAVLAVRDRLQSGALTGGSLPLDPRKKLIVVTAHRRESFGEGLASICNAVADLAARNDAQIVWPVHPNPAVERTVFGRLGQTPNVLLLQPLEYVPFVDLLQRACFLITDSGGIQEEGPALGKPILVLREKTERPEALATGTVQLVGCDRKRITEEAGRLLDTHRPSNDSGPSHLIYGDGKASIRIAESIAAFLAAR